jgi:hypothetical protein
MINKVHKSRSFIFYGALFICLLISCDFKKHPSIDHKVILEKSSHLLNNDYALYYKTIPRDTLSKYLGNDFSMDSVRFILPPSDSLSLLFTNKKLNQLLGKLNQYEALGIDSLSGVTFPFVNSDQIPDHVKSRGPYLNNPSYYDVAFFSTPLISNNQAIVFKDSYGHQMQIYFFVKNENWELLEIGDVNTEYGDIIKREN